MAKLLWASQVPRGHGHRRPRRRACEAPRKSRKDVLGCSLKPEPQRAEGLKFWPWAAARLQTTQRVELEQRGT